MPEPSESTIPASDPTPGPAPRGNRVGLYKALLAAGGSPPRGIESTAGEGAGAGEPDLSEPAIRHRLDTTARELRRIVDEHLGGSPALHELAQRLVAQGDEALRALRNDDEERLGEEPLLLAGLETIVRTDGSRPSFMVRNGDADVSTSPVGSWGPTLQASAEALRDAIACVGRVDAEGEHVGTGFLVQENVILTNRHVLQGIADHHQDGDWTFRPGATIDFGHEYRAVESVNPRALRRLVFTSGQPIALSGPVEHAKLDLALIELAPASAANRPRQVLALDIATDWAQPKATVFTIGYPAEPGPFQFPPSLLEQLFQGTYSHKRLAPGLVIGAQAPSVHTWTMAHDATTLGGNSGSVVLVAGREHLAAGLHYGGRRAEPRENWGHVLGRALDQTDGRSATTLRDHLRALGVGLVDRVVSGPA
jgi:V8-like Glu-specific endopeptidase